jgi:hypothetical protein
MEKQLREFRKEITLLRKIVNEYLRSNDALAGMEMNMISLKLKPKAYRGRRSLDELDFYLNGGSDEVPPEQCKICTDTNGNQYCYYGPGSCPTF